MHRHMLDVPWAGPGTRIVEKQTGHVVEPECAAGPTQTTPACTYYQYKICEMSVANVFVSSLSVEGGLLAGIAVYIWWNLAVFGSMMGKSFVDATHLVHSYVPELRFQ